MNLTHWNPLRELEAMSDRLNRIVGFPSLPASERESLATADWIPSVDVEETDAEYRITADVPAVKKEDISVEVREGTLYLRGERRREKEREDSRYHRLERSYGKFVRGFSMPEDADFEKVRAEFKDGQLRIHVPKTESRKPKSTRVPVE